MNVTDGRHVHFTTFDVAKYKAVLRHYVQRFGEPSQNFHLPKPQLQYFLDYIHNEETSTEIIQTIFNEKRILAPSFQTHYTSLCFYVRLHLACCTEKMSVYYCFTFWPAPEAYSVAPVRRKLFLYLRRQISGLFRSFQNMKRVLTLTVSKTFNYCAVISYKLAILCENWRKSFLMIEETTKKIAAFLWQSQIRFQETFYHHRVRFDVILWENVLQRFDSRNGKDTLLHLHLPSPLF